MLNHSPLLCLLPFLVAGSTAHAGENPLPSAAPWSAPASTIVIQEDKLFRNGDAELSGTLYLPQHGRTLSAIVVTHGASSPLRSAPLYQHLKEMLPALGVAVLIYDRRNSGQSTGTANGDYRILTEDALAAVKLLASDPRIDPKRIGVWGLSQGGWLSLLAARSQGVAFAVSISAPLVTPDVQMMFSSENSLRVNGYSQADIDQMKAARKAVDDYMRGTADRERAQQLTDAIKTKPWFKYLYMGETVRDRNVSGWRKEIEHDPLETIQGVSVPILVLYGANDPVVPVATSVARLKAIAARLPDAEVRVIAGADHSMQTSVDPKVQLDPAYSNAGKPDAAEYFAVLSNWLTRRGLTRE